MSYIKSYTELVVWQKGIRLVKEIYLLTSSFPRSEIYGIVSQIRRASVSISINIAEGYGRKTMKDYARYYYISYGSALELQTLIIISKDLQLTDKTAFVKTEHLLKEVASMLNAMTTKMKKLHVEN